MMTYNENSARARGGNYVFNKHSKLICYVYNINVVQHNNVIISVGTHCMS